MWSLLCKKLTLPDPPECTYSNARRLRSLLTMEQFQTTWMMIDRLKANVNPARYHLYKWVNAALYFVEVVAARGGLAHERETAMDDRAPVYVHHLYDSTFLAPEVLLSQGDNQDLNDHALDNYMDMIVDRILSDVLHEGLKENLVFRDTKKDVSILTDRDRSRSERGRTERGSPSKKRGSPTKNNNDSPGKKGGPEMGMSGPADGGRSRSPSPFSALRAITGAISGAVSDAVQGLGADSKANGGDAPTDPSKLTMKKIKIQKKEVMIYHCGSTVYMSTVIGKSELTAINSPFASTPSRTKPWLSPFDLSRFSSRGAMSSPYNKSLMLTDRSERGSPYPTGQSPFTPSSSRWLDLGGPGSNQNPATWRLFAIMELTTVAAVLKRNRDKNILHGVQEVDLFTGGTTAVDDGKNSDPKITSETPNLAVENQQKERSGSVMGVDMDDAVLEARREGRGDNNDAWLHLVADCVQLDVHDGLMKMSLHDQRNLLASGKTVVNGYNSKFEMYELGLAHYQVCIYSDTTIYFLFILLVNQPTHQHSSSILSLSISSLIIS